MPFSLHRPTEPYFLDFSFFSRTDEMYDEAYGPKPTIYRCEDDHMGDADDGEEFDSIVATLPDRLKSGEGAYDRYHTLADRHGYRFEEPDDLEEWLVWRYGQYLEGLSYDRWAEPCAAGMQHGCRHAELKATSTDFARKHVCSRDPKRNRGRKMREWWSTLANERRKRSAKHIH